jgi:hypothetical protein
VGFVSGIQGWLSIYINVIDLMNIKKVKKCDYLDGCQKKAYDK